MSKHYTEEFREEALKQVTDRGYSANDSVLMTKILKASGLSTKKEVVGQGLKLLE